LEFCYFGLFDHENFWGYVLICRNAEGVHGHRKVGNPCANPLPQNLMLKCLRFSPIAGSLYHDEWTKL